MHLYKRFEIQSFASVIKFHFSENKDKMALGILDTAALPFFARISNGLEELFNLLKAEFLPTQQNFLFFFKKLPKPLAVIVLSLKNIDCFILLH